MKTKELNHVAIHVTDVERSVDFYQNVLGFEPMQRPAFDFPGAWFRLGTTQELHIIGQRDESETVTAAPRGNHFALEIDDIKETEAFLKNQGITNIIGPKERPGNAWQIFIHDPDGHCIEFTEIL